MITITAPWIDEKQQRPVLEKLRRVKPLLPDIEAAHAGLLASQKKETASSAALAKLDAQATELDRQHDTRARGLFNTMTGLRDLLDDEELRVAVKAARDELMPAGLSIITRSYLDEAGEAELVEERLSAASKKVLKQLSVAGVTLAKWVDLWLASARELGEVERERIKLQRQLGAEPSAGANTVRARNEWIRTVSAVQQMLGLEKDLDDATRASVLDHLDDALAKADRRGARPKKTAEPEAPAGKPGAAPAAGAPLAEAEEDEAATGEG